MKRWALNIPIFDVEIEIVLGDEISKIAKYVEDAYDNYIEYIPGTVAVTYDISDGPIIIGLTSNDQWYMLHECLHAVHKIFNRKGIQDEETFCYLGEWLYREVYTIVNG